MTSANPSRPSTAAVAIALLIVYVVWGSTYLGIAVMIETLPPLLAAGVRYATAGLLVLGALAARARFRRSAEPAERPTAAHWRSAFIVGALLLLGGNGGVVLSELFIPSGITAVLVATTPIWLAVFDAVLSRRWPSGLVIGGLIAGIVGVAILVAPVESVAEVDPLGVGLVTMAEISWAAGSLYARRAPLPRSPLLGTGLEMLAGGILLVAAGSVLGEIGRTDVTEFSLRSIAALAYLIVFGSIVAFTAYTWLLANVPVSTVGTYAYVNPIVAVALGAVLLSEPITPRTLIATVIILGAVVAMVSGRPRDGTEEAGPAPEAATPEAATPEPE
ncbi:MAG: EamA family transporter [Chloroflexota bacterium]|nr:EamA family transporter [Chloroflexota bacterium]